MKLQNTNEWHKVGDVMSTMLRNGQIGQTLKDVVYNDGDEIVIYRATCLAKWLIENKGTPRKQAYIIASRKYKIMDYNLIRAKYQTMKPKQLNIFD